MFAQVLLVLLSLLFCLAVIYGALSDISTFTIPNWVSGALVAGFIVFALLRWGEMPLVFHLLVALITFVVCFPLWKFKLLGGGDLKFLTSISLWMGPNSILPFLFALGVAAAVFALALMWLRRWNAYFQGSRWPRFVKQLVAKAKNHTLPYGLPIAIAAIVAVPIVFGPEPIALPHLPPVSHSN
jgi:prepilin peptidase CpaA